MLNTKDQKIRKEQGKRIAATRGLSLLSLREFHEKTGMSVATLNNLENRWDTGITPRTFKRLVEAFEKVGVEVSIEFLRDGLGFDPINTKLRSRGFKSPSRAIKRIKSFIEEECL